MIVVRSNAPVIQTLIACVRCNNPAKLVQPGKMCSSCEAKERKATEARAAKAAKGEDTPTA